MELKYSALGYLLDVEEKDGIYVASRWYTLSGLDELGKLISNISAISNVEIAIGIGEYVINELYGEEIYGFDGRLSSTEKTLIKSLSKFKGSLKIKHDDVEYLIGIEKISEKEDAYWVVISTEEETEEKAHQNLIKLLYEIGIY